MRFLLSSVMASQSNWPVLKRWNGYVLRDLFVVYVYNRLFRETSSRFKQSSFQGRKIVFTFFAITRLDAELFGDCAIGRIASDSSANNRTYMTSQQLIEVGKTWKQLHSLNDFKPFTTSCDVLKLWDVKHLIKHRGTLALDRKLD